MRNISSKILTRLEEEDLVNSDVQKFVNKYNPLYDEKPFMKDGVLWADNIQLRGSGISKRVMAKYVPGKLEVYNEEWGFSMNSGVIDTNSLEDMSQYWFYDDYENNEEFRSKINKAAKGLYKDIDSLYKSMNPITESSDSEVHTVENDPAWAAAVAKVNKKYEEDKPEIISELKKELKAYRNKFISDGYSKAEVEKLPMIKAYKDAIKDPDDIWCECGKYAGEDLYKEDGDVYLGVEKHGWICPNCSKYTQIG